MLSQTVLTAVLLGLASATTPPTYPGFNLVWSSNFDGDANAPPGSANWQISTGNPGTNGELEVYTGKAENIRLSGKSTLQILPQKSGGTWTSGKITSKNHVAPAAGKKTRVEASISFGAAAAAKQAGIWPAFWMLGTSINNGVAWPGCGKLASYSYMDPQS